METAPTSIEVLLRPALGQSDEPSDLRGSLSPTSVYSTWQSPGGHPSNYEPGATLLNFSDKANHDERSPYSVYDITKEMHAWDILSANDSLSEQNTMNTKHLKVWFLLNNTDSTLGLWDSYCTSYS